jgi:hypothetical protein
MCKMKMRLLLVAISLGLQAVNATAEVPRLDVGRTCRAESAGQDKTAVDTCMADEQRARDQLTKEWEQFAVDIRANCTREATGIIGIQSYVELLTCLEIARDAKKLPKE